MRPIFHPRPAVSLLALALIAALGGACRKAQQSRVDPSAPRYTVRGEVMQVDDAPSGRSLLVHHEAVPDFVDSSGARVGMASMTMQFQVGPAARADDVKPGDRIRMRFAMDWRANAMEIESIEPLPAGTELVFGR